MKAKDLKKGKSYYYTAGAEWVKVTYKYKTINGYLFTSDGVDNALATQSVELYIEEI
ncbi:hypothetical protein GGR21_000742 [Dysgonomonas hofstadii]|uniref:Uncharacterized protein n=1 Tax=Dysgonomonas hofstadii TaxID=637886 RepID=A0A840CPG2_9BACT|nr:hypothetical protein [Dysgonomonas hofstadii]MBB4034855.1 hypothetical protein [Dysgonomonas hofstadii]